MSFLLELAGNKAKARAAAKELTVSQLQNLIAGFENALVKLQEEEELAQIEKQEKIKTAAAIAEMIAKSGLTMDEVTALSDVRSTVNKVKKVKSVAPKYRINVAGETHEWTGRGRTPKVFQAYFDSGKSKESCTI